MTRFSVDPNGEWESQHEYPGGTHDIRRIEKKIGHERWQQLEKLLQPHVSETHRIAHYQTFQMATEQAREELAAATEKLNAKTIADAVHARQERERQDRQNAALENIVTSLNEQINALRYRVSDLEEVNDRPLFELRKSRL